MVLPYFAACSIYGVVVPTTKNLHTADVSVTHVWHSKQSTVILGSLAIWEAVSVLCSAKSKSVPVIFQYTTELDKHTHVAQELLLTHVEYMRLIPTCKTRASNTDRFTL